MKKWIVLTLALCTQAANAENRTHNGVLYCGLSNENSSEEEKIFSTKVQVNYLEKSNSQQVAGIHATQVLDIPGNIQAQAEIIGGGYGYTYFRIGIRKNGKIISDSTFRLTDKLAFQLVYEDKLADLTTETKIGNSKISCEFNYFR